MMYLTKWNFTEDTYAFLVNLSLQDSKMFRCSVTSNIEYIWTILNVHQRFHYLIKFVGVNTSSALDMHYYVLQLHESSIIYNTTHPLQIWALYEHYYIVWILFICSPILVTFAFGSTRKSIKKDQ